MKSVLFVLLFVLIFSSGVLAYDNFAVMKSGSVEGGDDVIQSVESDIDVINLCLEECLNSGIEDKNWCNGEVSFDESPRGLTFAEDSRFYEDPVERGACYYESSSENGLINSFDEVIFNPSGSISWQFYTRGRGVRPESVAICEGCDYDGEGCSLVKRTDGEILSGFPFYTTCCPGISDDCSYCGDKICKGEENVDNCEEDCSPNPCREDCFEWTGDAEWCQGNVLNVKSPRNLGYVGSKFVTSYPNNIYGECFYEELKDPLALYDSLYVNEEGVEKWEFWDDNCYGRDCVSTCEGCDYLGQGCTLVETGDGVDLTGDGVTCCPQVDGECVYCGDGTCDKGEDRKNCASDCDWLSDPCYVGCERNDNYDECEESCEESQPNLCKIDCLKERDNAEWCNKIPNVDISARWLSYSSEDSIYWSNGHEDSTDDRSPPAGSVLRDMFMCHYKDISNLQLDLFIISRNDPVGKWSFHDYHNQDKEFETWKCLDCTASGVCEEVRSGGGYDLTCIYCLCPFLAPPGCGNFKVDEGEQCDDGGNVNGDGCDAFCKVELKMDLGAIRSSEDLGEHIDIGKEPIEALSGEKILFLNEKDQLTCSIISPINLGSDISLVSESGMSPVDDIHYKTSCVALGPDYHKCTATFDDEYLDELVGYIDDANEKIACEIIPEDSSYSTVTSDFVWVRRNVKNEKFYGGLGRAAFFISDENTNNILRAISVVSNTEDVGEGCVLTDDENSDKCAYPFFPYDKADIGLDSGNYAEFAKKLGWFSGNEISSSIYGFVNELYPPETLVFIDGDSKTIKGFVPNSNLNIKTFSSSDLISSAWSDMGLVVLVHKDNSEAGILATKIATIFDAPLVFAGEDGWEDMVRNKLIIALDYEGEGDFILRARELGVILKYNNGKIVYDEEFSETTLKSTFVSVEGTNKFADYYSFVKKVTDPMGVILVNPNDNNDEFCDKNKWHCKNSVLSTILAISDEWVIDFIGGEDPWEGVIKSAATGDFVKSSKLFCTADDATKAKDELFSQVKWEAEELSGQVDNLVSNHYPGRDDDPNFLLLGSPRDISSRWVTLFHSGACTSCGGTEFFDDMTPKYMESVSEKGFYSRIFARQSSSTSSYLNKILFSSALMPPCPDFEEDDDFVGPPRISFLLGYIRSDLRKNNQVTSWNNLRIKQLSESTFGSHNFKDPKDLESYYFHNPSTKIYGMERNYLSCYLNYPWKTELSDYIAVEGDVPDEGPSYFPLNVKPYEQRAAIAFYYATMTTLRQGIMASYENIAGIDTLINPGKCLTYVDGSKIGIVADDPVIKDKFGEDIYAMIKSTQERCEASVSRAKWDEIVDELNEMLWKERELYFKIEPSRVGGMVDEAYKSRHLFLNLAGNRDKLPHNSDTPDRPHFSLSLEDWEAWVNEYFKKATGLDDGIEEEVRGLLKKAKGAKKTLDDTKKEFSNKQNDRLKLYPYTLGSAFKDEYFSETGAKDSGGGWLYPSSESSRVSSKKMHRRIVKKALNLQLALQRESSVKFITDSVNAIKCIHSDQSEVYESANVRWDQQYDACLENLDTLYENTVAFRLGSALGSEKELPLSASGAERKFAGNWIEANALLTGASDVFKIGRQIDETLEMLHQLEISAALTVVTMGMSQAFINLRTAIALQRGVNLAGKVNVWARLFIVLSPDAYYAYKDYGRVMEDCDKLINNNFDGQIGDKSLHPKSKIVIMPVATADYDACVKMAVTAIGLNAVTTVSAIFGRVRPEDVLKFARRNPKLLVSQFAEALDSIDDSLRRDIFKGLVRVKGVEPGDAKILTMDLSGRKFTFLDEADPLVVAYKKQYGVITDAFSTGRLPPPTSMHGVKESGILDGYYKNGISSRIAKEAADREAAAEFLEMAQGRVKIEKYMAKKYKGSTIENLYRNDVIDIKHILGEVDPDPNVFPGLKDVLRSDGVIDHADIAQYIYSTEASSRILRGNSMTSLFTNCDGEIKAIISVDRGTKLTKLFKKIFPQGESVAEIGNLAAVPGRAVRPKSFAGTAMTVSKANEIDNVIMLVKPTAEKYYRSMTRSVPDAINEISEAGYREWYQMTKKTATLDNGWKVRTMFDKNTKKTYMLASGEFFGKQVKDIRINDAIFYGKVDRILESKEIGVKEFLGN